MNNIAQLSSSVDSLSGQLFKFSTEIKPLTLFDSLPDNISSIFDDSFIQDLVQKALDSVTSLNDALDPFFENYP